MRNDLGRDVREYSEAFFAAIEPVETSTIESGGGTPARLHKLQAATADQPSHRWLFGVAAAAAALVVVGGVALAVRNLQSGDVAAGSVPSPLAAAGTLDSCPWTSTTIAPDGAVVPCPEPQTDEERALAAAHQVLGEDGFAGMWFEDEGTAIVVAYVGAKPDIDDLPGVDRLVERATSLRDLELEADRLNQANDDDSFFWRVNVIDGSVEREGIGERVVESECDEARAQLSSGELIWDDLTEEQRSYFSNQCGIGWN